MNKTIVAAGPEQVFFQGRLRCGKNGAVHFHAGIILGDRTAAGTLPFLIVGGKVAAQGRPGSAFIFGSEEYVSAGIELFGIVGREEDREVPLKPVFGYIGAGSQRVIGPYAHRPVFAGPVIEPGEVAAVVAAVNDIRVQRIGHHVTALRSGGSLPFVLGDLSAVATRQDTDGGIILLRSKYAIRIMVVRTHPVELRRRLVHIRAPVVAAIKAHLCAAVVGNDHTVAIGGVDPEIVVIAMRRVDVAERFTAIGAFQKVYIEYVHDVLVFRIGEYLGIIPGTLADIVITALQGPVFTSVVTHVQSAIFILEQRIHFIGVGRTNGYPHNTPGAFGQSLMGGNILPGLTSIHTFPYAAALATAFQAIGRTQDAPGSGIQYCGVARFHHQVAATGLIIYIQYFFPAAAAIGGFENTPFFIGTEEMADGRHPYDIGILGMNDDADDMPRILQADITPAAASIIGTPDAEAFAHIAPQGIFPFAHIEDGGIAGCNGHATDTAAEIFITDVLPVAATVDGFPYTAARSAEIERVLLAVIAGHGPAASAAERTDGTVFHFTEQDAVFIDNSVCLFLLRWGSEGSQADGREQHCFFHPERISAGRYDENKKAPRLAGLFMKQVVFTGKFSRRPGCSPLLYRSWFHPVCCWWR